MQRVAPPSDWKGAFSALRTLSSGTTVAVTVTLAKQAPLPAALGVAVLAAAWSGAMQYWNAPYLNWLAQRRWLSVTPPRPEEQATMRQRWFKKFLSTTTYGLLLTTGFFLTGLNARFLTTGGLARLAKMVVDSLYNQTGWMALNQKWTQDAIEARPARTYLYRRWSQVGSLALCAVNIATNVLNISGSRWGTVVALTVGTTGNLILARVWLRESPSSVLWPAPFSQPAGNR